MHELLLTSPLPPHRHTQLLNILSGLSAMQPAPLYEKHVVFKPDSTTTTAAGAEQKQPTREGSEARGQTQQTERQDGRIMIQEVRRQLAALTKGGGFYLRVVGVGRGMEGEGDAARMGMGVKGEGEGEGDGYAERREGVMHYTIHFRDVPDAGQKQRVVSRLMADIPITVPIPQGEGEGEDKGEGGGGQDDAVVAFMAALGYRYVQPLSPPSFSASPFPTPFRR